jgi:hypothetical protein
MNFAMNKSQFANLRIFAPISRKGERATKLKTFLDLPFVKQKYSRAGILILLFFLQGFLWSGCGRMHFPGRSASGDEVQREVVATNIPADSAAGIAESGLSPIEPVPNRDSLATTALPIPADSAARIADASGPADSLPRHDSLTVAQSPDSLAAPLDSLGRDSLGRRKYGKQFIDEIITEKNSDSLVYDVRGRKIYIYNQAEVNYLDKKLLADYMIMNMDDKMLYAHGVPDSTGAMSRPVFDDAGQKYDMDSINYNLTSSKMKIRGVWTTEGEGYLYLTSAKKMPDNTINISHGLYTTCDAPHPHFYIRIPKGKLIPGKKTIFERASLVIEDVPIPFIMLPFGFFPMNTENSSGFIMPSFGEDAKGFFLKNGGYYYIINDYLDAKVTGGIYTLGSWEGQFDTRYMKRYRYNGVVNLSYSNNKFGDRGSTDWNDQKTYSIRWSHSQDPKFKPGQTFTASVNFSSSQNGNYNPQTLNDRVSNQANSSIAFSRNWAGTPFSLTASMTHSQINRDTTYSFTLPNLSFSMGRVTPFKFRNRRPGPERWYEKISMTYNTRLNNAVSNVKEYHLFKQQMFDKMETTMSHSLPVSANFTLFNNITVTPSLNYSEDWNTKKILSNWDAGAERMVNDTIQGFHRTYRYGSSVSMNTTVYGMYDGFRPEARIQAVRHTLTPTVGVSFNPGFGDPKYGFYIPHQVNANGDVQIYSPYRSAPPQRTSASMNFSLNQTLEAKVRSDQDSTGVKKIKIIDELSFSFGYNFMGDSLRERLSNSVPVRLRSTLIPGFNINLNTSLGLFVVDPKTKRTTNELLWSHGKFPRVETLGTSFSWSKSFGKGNPNAMNTGSNITDPMDPFADPMRDPYRDPFSAFPDPYDEAVSGEIAEEDRYARLNEYRSLLSGQYYDFSVPLNVNFSYSIDYRNTGYSKEIMQTARFGGSVNLTPAWGVTFSSGYDFAAKKMSETNFTLTRDLHCMQMTFNWVPFGRFKSWNFHISVKANVLRDLKYEKSSSPYDY